MASARPETRRVVTRYEVDAHQVNAALKELTRQGARTAKSMRAIQRSTRETAQGMSFLAKQAKLLGAVFKSFVVFEVARMFIGMGDAATDTNARLMSIAGTFQHITTAADTSAVILRDITEVALKLGINVTDTSAAYVKLGQAMREASHNELVGTVDLLSTILAKTGASAQQTSSVLLQFSQAMGASALQGDEFRAIAENAPILLYAWREAMGKTSVAMKELSASGQLTTDSFRELLPEIQKNANELLGSAEVPLTVARAWENLKTQITVTLIELGGSSGVFEPLAKMIQSVADAIGRLTPAFQGLLNTLSVTGEAVIGLIGLIGDLIGWLVQVGVNIYDAFTGSNTAIEDFSSSMSDVFEVEIPSFIKAMLLYWGVVADDMADTGTFLKDRLGLEWERIKEGANLAWVSLQKSFAEAMHAMVLAAAKAAEAIVNRIIAPIDKASAKINQVFRTSIGAIGAVDLTSKIKLDTGPLDALEKSANKSREALKALDSEIVQGNELLRQRQKSNMEVAEAELNGYRTKLLSIQAERERNKQLEIGNRLTSGAPPGLPEPSGGGGGGGGGRAARDTSARDAERLARELERLRQVYIGLVEDAQPIVKITNDHAEVMRKLAEAVDKGAISWAEYSEGVGLATTATKKALDDIDPVVIKQRELNEALAKGFGDALHGVITGTKTWQEALHGLERALLDAITQLLVIGPLMKALEGSGGVTGIIGSILPFGGGVQFGGARAFGGPVQQGRAYLVGERGPELFIPRSSGVVHTKTGDTIERNVSVNIEFSGSVTGEGLRQSATQIAARTGAQVQQALNRNS